MGISVRPGTTGRAVLAIIVREQGEATIAGIADELFPPPRARPWTCYADLVAHTEERQGHRAAMRARVGGIVRRLVQAGLVEPQGQADLTEWFRAKVERLGAAGALADLDAVTFSDAFDDPEDDDERDEDTGEHGTVADVLGVVPFAAVAMVERLRREGPMAVTALCASGSGGNREAYYRGVERGVFEGVGGRRATAAGVAVVLGDETRRTA